jgi:hypothetical protein
MRGRALPSGGPLLAVGTARGLMANTDRVTVPDTGCLCYGPDKAAFDKT